MSEANWRNFFVVVRRALRMPVSLALVGGGVLWALLLGGGFWGLLGLVAALAAASAYALGKLRNEEFIRDAFREAREHERRADAMRTEFRIEELDVESRLKMKAIVKLASQIAEEVDNSPVDSETSGLADTLTQTEALVHRGLEMAQKRRELLRYLNQYSESSIQSAIDRLDKKITRESNGVRVSELSHSLAAKQQELADYRAIRASADRVVEELENIEVSFSSLRTRLVRIRSTDLREWAAANEELRTELVGLNSAVDTLEQSINEALSIGR